MASDESCSCEGSTSNDCSADEHEETSQQIFEGSSDDSSEEIFENADFTVPETINENQPGISEAEGSKLVEAIAPTQGIKRKLEITKYTEDGPQAMDEKAVKRKREIQVPSIQGKRVCCPWTTPSTPRKQNTSERQAASYKKADKKCQRRPNESG